MFIHKSSVTGRIVSKVYAEANKETTYKHEYTYSHCDAPYETPEGKALNDIIKEIADVNPEDTAELVLAGQEILNEARAARMYDPRCTPE